MEVGGLIGRSIAGGQRHSAVKADRVVDHHAVTEIRHRAACEHRGVARAKDGQRLALHSAGHFHLAANAFGLDHQRHRNRQGRACTAHRNRVGAVRRTDHQTRNARQLAQVEHQTATAAAAQRNLHASSWRHLQARTGSGKRRQIHRATALWNGDLDRLNHLRQHLAIRALGQHVLHRQTGICGAIHTVLGKRGQGDALAHIELDVAGIHDTQITLDHQALGIHYQPGIAQVDGRCALGLDHNRIAHQVQRAQGLVPDDLLDTRQHLPVAQSHHVLGQRLVHRFELQRQGVVVELTGSGRRVGHVLEHQGARQAVGSHRVAQVHDDLVCTFGGTHDQWRIGQAHHRQLVTQATQAHFIQGAVAQAQGVAAGRQNLEVARVVRGLQGHRLLYHQRHFLHADVGAVVQGHHQGPLDARCARTKLQIAIARQERRQVRHLATQGHAARDGRHRNTQSERVGRRHTQHARWHGEAQ